MEINGKVCAVTGVGRGLGCQIAVDLAKQGAKVYGCDINDESFKTIDGKIDPESMDITLTSCDVSDEESVIAFFKSIDEKEGRLDVLVNNAGITRDGLFVKIKGDEVKSMKLSDFQSVININLTGVFLCTREAVPIMAKNKSGVVISLSSISRAGNFGQTNYSASKAGVDAMTVTWSKELSKYNIRTAAIAPGYINTEMVAAINPSALEKIVAQIPSKRLGEMNEISKTIKFIVENDFVNGRTLEIDGGLRI